MNRCRHKKNSHLCLKHSSLKCKIISLPPKVLVFRMLFSGLNLSAPHLAHTHTHTHTHAGMHAHMHVCAHTHSDRKRQWECVGVCGAWGVRGGTHTGPPPRSHTHTQACTHTCMRVRTHTVTERDSGSVWECVGHWGRGGTPAVPVHPKRSNSTSSGHLVTL